MQYRSRVLRLGVCFGAFVGCADGSDAPEVEPAALSFWAPIELSAEEAPEGHVLVADANADGWFDVLTWGNETQQLNLADPVERGILRAREVTGLPAISVRQVYWLDLNGDKAADLLVLDDEGKLRRFDNRFGEEENPAKYKEVALEGWGELESDAFTLLDIDRDGALDIISCARLDANAGLRVDIHLSRASDYALTKRVILAVSEAEDRSTLVLYPSDVNNDGVWEIVIGADGLGWGVLYDERGFTDLLAEASAFDSGVTDEPAPFDAAAPAAADAPDAGPLDAGNADASGGQTEVGVVAELNSMGLRFELLSAGTEFAGSFVVADANTDGDLDLIRFSPSAEGQVLLGGGKGAFQSKSLEGIKKASSGCVEDFDNDTRLDVLTSGDKLALALAKSTFGEFEASVTMDDDANARRVACVDLDGDGDIDVLTAGADGTKLYINALEPLGHEDAHFFGFRFRGKEGNRAALGTRVAIDLEDSAQAREFVFAANGAAAPVPALHMGLGVAATIDEVTIVWPEGQERTDEDWEAGAVGTVIVP